MTQSARYIILCAATMLPMGAFAADTAAGKAIFDGKCKTCHLVDGTGNPAIAKMMKVEMKPLADQTDAEIKTAVTMGVGKMKPVTGVADLDSLVAYIHTLKK